MTSTVRLQSPPGYGPVVPLDKTRHANLGLRGDVTHAWCANLNSVYVSVGEFPRAALDYPIALAREPKSGELMPLAVLGLQQQNLFVDGGGQWRKHVYVPAYVRRYPFCIAEVPAASGEAPKRLVCVQEDQLAAGGNTLFDATGTPTLAWQPIEKLLEAIEGARRQTADFLKRLEAKGLVVPFDALALPRGGGQMRLKGMLRVDEQRLNKLPGKEVREFLGQGEWRAIYAHLLSLENFARLLDLEQDNERLRITERRGT